MGFKQEKFKKLIEHKSGYTWGKEQELDKPEEGAVRVLTVTNIQEKLDLSSELYLKDVKDRDRKEKSVSKDWTIAVSSNGNRKRIGNAIFISDDTDYLFASFLTAFKPKQDTDITPEYFFQWFSSHVVQERITSVSEGTTGLGNLDIRYLRNMDIEYPDNEVEQKAIATILSKVDEAIKATENSIKAAEKLKKSLMQNLLTGKLKPDGTWRKEDEFYKDEKFGNVPEGWVVKKGNKITDKITKGQSPKWQGFEYQTEGVLFVTSENVLDGFIDVSSPKYLPIEFNDKIKNSQLQNGDILINIVGASIGRCAVYNLSVEFANTNQAVCVFRPNSENDSDFIAYYIQLEHTQRRLLGNSVETARANLSLGDFRKFKFIIPEDKSEQVSIAAKIKEIDSVYFSKHQKIKSLQRLKKALMQNLLTGKVRVDLNKISSIDEAI